MNNWTRKEFLKTSLIGGGAALIASQTKVYGQAGSAKGSANGDARVAVVGVRSQGRGHMLDYASRLKSSRLVAICDADSEILAQRAEACASAGAKVTTYGDYRKLLEDKSIDAVVIATPNHQHSLMTIWALQAGKDVYVEKPLSHNVWEGRQAVEASRKYKKNLVQAGTQNRSSQDIMEALAFVNAGNLGKIQWARALCYKQRDSIGKTTGAQKVPANVNYDLWTGPADLIPPHRNSKSNGPIHYDWHWFWNYGGGDISNQGIHQMDVARWFLGEPSLPPTVMSFGGRFGYQDDAETPNTLVSVLAYPKAPLIFEVRGLPTKSGMRAMDRYRGASIGVIVQYEGGYVHVSENGTAVIYDQENKPIKKLAKNTLGDHRPAFVRALHARKVVVGVVDEAHVSSALCHLANVSYLLGAERSNAALAEAIKADTNTKDSFARMLDHLKANSVDVDATKTVVGPLLKIDGAKECFTGADQTIVSAANKCPLLKRTGRAPFSIPDIKKLA